MAEQKATRQEIGEFLEEFRVRSGIKVDIEPCPKNIKFLLSNNLSNKDAYDVILNDLDYTHYFSGPEDDYNKKIYPGPIWKFKINKFETTIYIKLKLYEGKFLPEAKCLSFHNDKNKF